MNSEDRHAIAWTIFLFIAVCLLWLAGCGEVRSQPPVEPSVADQLRGIGSSFLGLGGITLGLGVLIRLLGFAAPIFFPALGFIATPVIAGLANLAIATGGSAVVTGASFTWLADYFWAVIVACVATGLALGWYYWPRIRNLIRARLNARQKA
jgi:hypothetical protein